MGIPTWSWFTTRFFVNATSSPTDSWNPLPRFVWVKAAELTVLRVIQLDARQPEMWEITGDSSSLLKSWVHIFGTQKTWDHKGLIRILQIYFLVFGEECLLSLIFFWNIKYPILSRQKYEIQQEHTLKIPSAQQNPVVHSGKWSFYSNSLGSENLETHRYFGALSLLFEGFPLKKSRPLLAKKNAINPITIASLMPHYLQRNSTH